jgi:hypothetical protein
MDVLSNTFCACGAQLGNGTWAIFGGNQRKQLLPLDRAIADHQPSQPTVSLLPHPTIT